MIDFSFETLRRLGLTPLMAQTLARIDGPIDGPTPVPAPAAAAQRQWMRATAAHRETVDVHDGTQAHAARTAARLTRSLLEQRSALVVGDWVLCARDAHQPWQWWAAVAC